MDKTAVEKVRDYIGDHRPQLPIEDYEDRIDRELKNLSAEELLTILSNLELI